MTLSLSFSLSIPTVLLSLSLSLKHTHTHITLIYIYSHTHIYIYMYIHISPSIYTCIYTLTHYSSMEISSLHYSSTSEVTKIPLGSILHNLSLNFWGKNFGALHPTPPLRGFRCPVSWRGPGGSATQVQGQSVAGKILKFL